MKISLYQQNVPETEKQHPEKNGPVRDLRGASPASGAVSGVLYSENSQNWAGGVKTEKGKSLLEIRQEAQNADVDIQQDYMTLMSHTMSEEDYAKLQEEGFDFYSMDPGEAVTIVDRIKAELARSGKEIKGYTDDLDLDTLAAALGSQTLANAVADSFRAADLPMTEENLEAVEKAWNMAAELQPQDDGSSRYMIDNELEPEIWNLYLAQNSGAGAAGGGAPRYYAEDVEGYYTRSAGPEADGELGEQIDRMIAQSGREVKEENRQNAAWLLDNGLPLTEENLDRLEELQGLCMPVKEEEFARAAAKTIAEGRDPIHANLGGDGETLYEKAARLAQFYQSDEILQQFAGDVTARRQLEEIRLRMTAEVNIRLLKSGFSIDTAPMEQLVEALKQAERELAEQYFPEDAGAVEKYRVYHAANRVAEDLPGLPAQALGTFAEGQTIPTVEEFHREGKTVQENYERARESYETLMTAPRADLGDSIKKAFANVDDILRDLGVEPGEETRRAARILGYNRMEMTVENLNAVMEADRQVKSVVEKLTPAAVLKMIRDGVNPLEKTFGELEDYFERMPEEYRREAESYSRFLYGLEQNKAITQAERESYIGIYRLVRQIEKTDGAAIGALVNTQAELHFSNLLSAVRSGKVKSVNVKVADELGTVSELVRRGETIPEQIGKAFARIADDVLTEVSYDETAEREYDRQQLEALREAVNGADAESIALLQRGQLSSGAENLMAAQALLNDSFNLFDVPTGGRRSRNGSFRENTTGVSEDSGRGQTQAAEPQKEKETQIQAPDDRTEAGEALWEDLSEKEQFIQQYDRSVQEAAAETEYVSLQEAGASLDVRGLQLLHKQLSVMGALSAQEEYFLPLYVGGTLTKVHLTFDRSGGEKGFVSVSMRLSDQSRLEAGFSLRDGVLKGVFRAQDSNEVMKLHKLADIFKEEVGETWTVGDIEVAVTDTGMAAEPEDAVSAVDNAELYRVAKVFLQAVQKRGNSL